MEKVPSQGILSKMPAYAPEGMGTINTAPIIVTKQFKELTHILVTVDVSKQVQ